MSPADLAGRLGAVLGGVAVKEMAQLVVEVGLAAGDPSVLVDIGQMGSISEMVYSAAITSSLPRERLSAGQYGHVASPLSARAGVRPGPDGRAPCLGGPARAASRRCGASALGGDDRGHRRVRGRPGRGLARCRRGGY